MKLPIVKHPNPILSMLSMPIKVFDENLSKLTENMLETMQAAKGIGLAAPQIGELLRIFVMRKKDMFVLIAVNPIIIEASGFAAIEEQCLSLPGFTNTVPRYNKITLEYYTEYGEDRIEELEGLDAICVQHEIDHLNGITILSR